MPPSTNRLVSVALCLFLAAVPLTIAGMNLAAGLLTLALGAAAWRERSWRWDKSWSPPVAALAAYAAVGLLSAAVSADPESSLRCAAKDLHKVWIALILLQAFSRSQGPWHERAAAASFAALAAIGLWQVATERTGDEAWRRAHGFVHPVTYGEIMAFPVLGAICVSAAEGSRLRGRRLFLWICFLTLCLSAVALSQTRGAVVGLVGGAFAAAAADKRLRKWAAGVILGAVLIAAVLEVIPTGGRSLSKIFRAPEMGTHGRLNPYGTRWILWGVALDVFQDHPALGVGPGRYGAAFNTYYAGELDGQRSWSSAHNIFLHQLAERGFIGFLALCAALGGLLWSVWRRACRDPGPWPLWGVSAVGAFILMNLTETAFQNEQIAALALAVWAWGLAAPSRTAERE